MYNIINYYYLRNLLVSNEIPFKFNLTCCKVEIKYEKNNSYIYKPKIFIKGIEIRNFTEIEGTFKEKAFIGTKIKNELIETNLWKLFIFLLFRDSSYTWEKVDEWIIPISMQKQIENYIIKDSSLQLRTL